MSGLGLNLPRRMRILGRLRMGDQVQARNSDKMRPHRLACWRVTSAEEWLLVHVAEVYGGTVRPWTEGPTEGHQFELYTESDALDVILPPDRALSQSWEMWSGGGCQRRCDGVTMESGHPCLCPEDLNERMAAARQVQPKACKPITRLQVCLVDVPDIGVWQLSSTSLNAGIELPGMVDVLQAMLGGQKWVPARLVIDMRSDRHEGSSRHYSVPVLSMPRVRMEALLSAQPGMLAELARPAERFVATNDLATAEVPVASGDDPGDEPSNNREERSNNREPGPVSRTGSRPVASAAPDVDGLAARRAALMEKVSAIRPASKAAECMRTIRDQWGAPSELSTEALEAVEALIAGYMPIETRTMDATRPAAPAGPVEAPVVPSQPPTAPQQVPQPPRQPDPAPDGQTETPIDPELAGWDRQRLLHELTALHKVPRPGDTDDDLRRRLSDLRAKARTPAKAVAPRYPIAVVDPEDGGPPVIEAMPDEWLTDTSTIPADWVDWYASCYEAHPKVLGGRRDWLVGTYQQ